MNTTKEIQTKSQLPLAANIHSQSPAPTPMYKGKFAHRSWQQLPPEVIRFVLERHLEAAIFVC